ncbi:hypothetical protein AAC387_Pa02g2152 [Persea americana]
MPVFKEDKLGCCARGTMSFIARAQPELTDAQIARRICRRAAYRQKRLEKQRSQHSELQISQKWVKKERPDQVAAVHMVGKTKRRQKSATKIHVRRPVTRSVSRTTGDIRKTLPLLQARDIGVIIPRALHLEE